jgi:hypothetical protein
MSEPRNLFARPAASVAAYVATLLTDLRYPERLRRERSIARWLRAESTMLSAKRVSIEEWAIEWLFYCGVVDHPSSRHRCIERARVQRAANRKWRSTATQRKAAKRQEMVEAWIA